MKTETPCSVHDIVNAEFYYKTEILTKPVVDT